MGKIIKPDFIIVGAAKSGTTTLHKYLSQHTDVFMSIPKETNYFAFRDPEFVFNQEFVQKNYIDDSIKTESDYIACFARAKSYQIAGEASPSYLYNKNTPLLIKNALPNCKIIIILRNPVDRAYSNFKHHLRINIETTASFERALALEKRRISEKWWWGFHYYAAGLYYEQVKRYYELFPRENILTLIYEDFFYEEEKNIGEVYNFLGINKLESKLEKTILNSSVYPRFYNLQKIINNKEVKSLFKKVVPITFGKRIVKYINIRNKRDKILAKKIQAKLAQSYNADVRKLEGLIQKDLAVWGIY